MESGTVQWSNLPKDLLRMVAKRLDSRTDILRLRAVCTSWRSSLPHSLKNCPLFSVKFPFPIGYNHALNPKRHGYFTLCERTIYYLEPCSGNPKPKGWMVKVDESESAKIRILDPLWKVQAANSPKVSPQIVNLLNFRVSEVSKVYDLQFVGDDMDIEFNELKSIRIRKVIVSPVPAWIDDISSAEAILTIHTGWKLGYFKLGDTTWSTIDDGQEKSHYDDIAYHKGKFYAVDVKGRVIVIDTSLNVEVIEPPVPHYCGGQRKYLVEDGTYLYLVDKYLEAEPEIVYDEELNAYMSLEADYDSDCTIHFRVYKLNYEDKEWVPVSSLGDQALFVGDGGGCFSVPTRRFSACKKNSIYFTDAAELVAEEDDNPGSNVGMFDLENHTSGYLSSVKGYSRIFWPPPTWLKPKKSPKASSSRC